MVKTIDEAFDKIYSYIDYSMTHAENVDKSVFSLDKMKALLEALGNPQKAYPIIHVAGSKGKGSVCAMLAAAIQNAGFKTGLYTSPHLIRFNERIMINGKMISDRDLIDLVNKISVAAEAVPEVSSFEFMTAMAFEFFRQEKVEIAVVETGLGGKLDSTSAADPALTVITSISKDHMSFLGNSIEEIAAEKAGIIRPGVPVICGFQDSPAALKVLKNAAKEANSPWVYVPERYRYIQQRATEKMQKMLIWRVEDQKLMEKWCVDENACSWSPAEVHYPLKGSHQMQNAAVVYAALAKIKFYSPTFNMNAALQGIQQTFWPCRFEIIAEKPMLVLDGAHNEDSIRKLCAAIDLYCGTRPVKCIFGVSADKKYREMIDNLAPHVDEFIMTKSTHPRAANPEVLSRAAAAAGRKSRVVPAIEDAVALYNAENDPNCCYVATGSLFVTAGIRDLMMKEKDSAIPYFEIYEETNRSVNG